MQYVDYALLNPAQKAGIWLVRAIKRIPGAIVSGIKGLGHWARNRLIATGRFFRDIGKAFVHGGGHTRLSFLVMGWGCLAHGQIVKGLLYLAAQIVFILYMTSFGWTYIKDLPTLGTQTQRQIWNEAEQIYEYVTGDNSMLILLFGVLSVVLTLLFLCVYFQNIRAAFRAYQIVQEGQKPSGFREDIQALLDNRYHITLLSLPTLLISVFTILPLLFMVLMAFTNFDKAHQPPANLFTWIGLDNFKDVFWQDPLKSYTFSKLLGWTLVWAVFATFTNYIFGVILALMINKKGIRFKKFWRTMFVLTIAVPQFVSLMLMSQVLHEQGVLNVILQKLHLVSEAIPFLTDATLARISVIVVNMWVGIPYTILITTGILMNIPADLYESARIDGAGPAKTFFKITLPYMLFVTTPYLITQFVGNINNFNVIFLLTGGAPLTLDYYQAGKTDLLVTWLYKQTVNEQNYNLASTIGILVFLISAAFSLLVYRSSASSKKEEEFQ